MAGKSVNLADLISVPAPAEAKVPSFAGGGRSVSVTQVAANPLNTREISAHPRKITELAASIRAHGQLQPCAVVTAAAFLALFPEHQDTIEDARFVQVTGARRRAAILEAGLTSIEVVIKDDLAQSPTGFLAATAAENLDRENYDPVEEARAVQHLVTACGSGKDAAEQMGRSRGWVSQRLALLNLTPEVQAALRVDDDETRLPVREVRDWHNLDPAAQLAALHRWQQRNDGPVYRGKPGSEGTAVPTPRRPTRPSPAVTAWRKLGGNPADVAAKLRADLSRDDVRALAEELLREE